MGRDMHVDISQTMREATARLRKCPELLACVVNRNFLLVANKFVC